MSAIGVLWELPQTALGALLFGVERLLGTVTRVERDRGRIFLRSRRSAVSLGHFVFYCEPHTSRWFFTDRAVRAHEYGHTFQSRALGPLYLPLVGVPSVMRVGYAIAYREVTGRKWRGYFDGYPERGADRFGGVDRARMKATWTEG